MASRAVETVASEAVPVEEAAAPFTETVEVGPPDVPELEPEAADEAREGNGLAAVPIDEAAIAEASVAVWPVASEAVPVPDADVGPTVTEEDGPPDAPDDVPDPAEVEMVRVASDAMPVLVALVAEAMTEVTAVASEAVPVDDAAAGEVLTVEVGPPDAPDAAPEPLDVEMVRVALLATTEPDAEVADA